MRRLVQTHDPVPRIDVVIVRILRAYRLVDRGQFPFIQRDVAADRPDGFRAAILVEHPRDVSQQFAYRRLVGDIQMIGGRAGLGGPFGGVAIGAPLPQGGVGFESLGPVVGRLGVDVLGEKEARQTRGLPHTEVRLTRLGSDLSDRDRDVPVPAGGAVEIEEVDLGPLEEPGEHAGPQYLLIEGSIVVAALASGIGSRVSAALLKGRLVGAVLGAGSRSGDGHCDNQANPCSPRPHPRTSSVRLSMS
ncbi:MAG: hypothetical protein ACYTF1_17120 [Planctomycetota bacterium]